MVSACPPGVSVVGFCFLFFYFNISCERELVSERRILHGSVNLSDTIQDDTEAQTVIGPCEQDLDWHCSFAVS